MNILKIGNASACPIYTDSVRVHIQGRIISSTTYHEGALMQFDVDSYKPSATVNKKGHTIYVGKENDRCWRKDVCKGVEFYYYNVPTENKEKYDMLFDSIKIINIKGSSKN